MNQLVRRHALMKKTRGKISRVSVPLSCGCPPLLATQASQELYWSQLGQQQGSHCYKMPAIPQLDGTFSPSSSPTELLPVTSSPTATSSPPPSLTLTAAPTPIPATLTPSTPPRPPLHCCPHQPHHPGRLCCLPQLH
jgi:hypothetical protein